MNSRLRTILLIATLFIAGCRADGGDQTQDHRTDAPVETSSEASEPTETARDTVTLIENPDLPTAQVVAITAAPDGSAYVLYGENGTIYVARMGEDGEMSTPIQVNADPSAYLSAIEPPALAVDAEGRVHVAWMTQENILSDFWYARMEAESTTFSAPVRINETPQEFGTMINLAVDGEGSPTAAWLQGLTLVLAQSGDGGQTFRTTVIDDEVCDCCRPQLVQGDGGFFVAYRNSEYDDQGKNIRDVHVGWLDAQGEFMATRVADEHWYLNACPISGPSLTARDGNLLVTWMDGRNDTSNHMEHTDVWFAISTDGGMTFSPNTRITSENAAYRKLPTLALDASGALHIVWAEQSQGSALYYATSTDGGQTFSTPQLIKEGAGSNNPMLASVGGRLWLVWTDREGAHLALLGKAES